MRIETQDIYFIADFHLSHKNIIRFDNRPFKDIDEMHETLIRNWNSVVSENSIVYYLGDLSFGKMNYAKDFVNQLNGTIRFILGNHDNYSAIRNLNRFESISKEEIIYVKDDVKGGYQQLHLHHLPFLSWYNMHHGSIHLHAHTHQKMMNNKDFEWFYRRRVIDVGCNGWNYTPLSYSQVKTITQNKITPIGESI